jgi:hypothetical protein
MYEDLWIYTYMHTCVSSAMDCTSVWWSSIWGEGYIAVENNDALWVWALSIEGVSTLTDGFDLIGIDTISEGWSYCTSMSELDSVLKGCTSVWEGCTSVWEGWTSVSEGCTSVL